MNWWFLREMKRQKHFSEEAKPKMTVVTKEHVESAVASLEARGLFKDTNPDMPDGRRSAQRWLAAIAEDYGLVALQLEHSLDDRYGQSRDAKLTALKCALKEAHRMESDIRRFASEVHDVSWEELKSHAL